MCCSNIGISLQSLGIHVPWAFDNFLCHGEYELTSVVVFKVGSLIPYGRGKEELVSKSCSSYK